MVLSHFDFEETQHFLDRLQPSSDDVELVQDDAVRTALMTALLVSYWRHFSTSDADGQKTQRLPSEMLKGVSREHRNFMRRCVCFATSSSHIQIPSLPS